MSYSINNRQLQQLREVFDSFDTDRSGKISQKELASVVKSLNISLNEDELKKIVTAMDSNNSGQIEFDEFARVMVEQFYRTPSVDELRTAFRQFDQDNSGYIQAGEMEAVFKKLGRNLSRAEVEEVVRALDTSGDGKISFDEFARIFND